MARAHGCSAGPHQGVQDPAAPLTPLARDSLAFLVTSLAARLNRGAAPYYLRHFALGIADFRVVMALGRTRGPNVGEIALAADVDKAVASRSLKLLQARGLVDIEQTSTRGRAAIVRLTASGAAFERDVRRAARRREQRFQASLTPAERESVAALIRKLVDNVPAMNQD